MLAGYCVKIYENVPYFYQHHKEKIRVEKNGHKYILFRYDVYFFEYNLAVEVDEEGHADRYLIFEKKRHEALETKSTVNLLELILVKKNMQETMKLVECKHLLVILKMKN